MDEYASMRLTLRCRSAPRLPIVIDSTAIHHTRGSQCVYRLGTASNRMRSNTAKAAALGAVDIMPTTGDGAPS